MYSFFTRLLVGLATAIWLLTTWALYRAQDGPPLPVSKQQPVAEPRRALEQDERVQLQALSDRLRTRADTALRQQFEDDLADRDPRSSARILLGHWEQKLDQLDRCDEDSDYDRCHP